MIEIFKGKRRYRFTSHATNPTTYIEKINKYKHECGCSMGAILTVLALLTFAGRAFTLDWTTRNIFVYGLSSLFLIFIVAGIGKALGIGIAQIRLRLLYNFLIQNQYLEPISKVEKGNRHVNLY